MTTHTPSNSSSTTIDMDNQPASSLQRVLQQARFEILLTARRGENILVTLIIPVALLIAGGAFYGPSSANSNPISFLLPAVLAVAIIAAGLVNLGIATAYDRKYGVLKRLGSSPLAKSELIIAKIISIFVLEIVQAILLIAVSLIFYHWQPSGSFLVTLLVVLLGSVTFAAMGLAMAGGLRAETTLAGANALFLFFLLLGGGLLPLNRLPGPIADLARILPAAALTQALQQSMAINSGFPLTPLIILAVWAIIILLIAARTFKWE
jgi:ABC-2 type transport system permease protein